MSTNNVQTSSAAGPSAASSVRPRPKRLISGLSDGVDTELPTTPGLTPSALDSRSASPIPSAHPQRANSSQRTEQKFTGSSWGRRAQVGAQRNGTGQSSASPTLAGIWGTSWNTLQGIASDLLGNDAAENNVKDNTKRPLPKWYLQMALTPKETSSSPQWGPLPSAKSVAAPTATDIGKGTKQEREAALRAQKRKDMLLRENSSYSDVRGKFKRRLSDDMDTRSAPPGESDRAALVYLHHVQKDDTMAGITIKYNCSANVLRKANRMWANDTPQSRQTMVIPVGECGVKGKPLDSINGINPAETNKDLEEDPMKTPKATQPNGNPTPRTRTNSQTSSSTAAAQADTDPPWHHDSWVQLPGFTAPTEIARLSRRTLGYFPPARRKSISHSDTATPTTSLDLARVSTSDTQRPGETSRSPQRPRRTRRLSNANTGYFPSYLAGPGGVGTMNKNVRCPGPAQDGLNKIFAKHLPDVAPPRNQVDLYQPEVPLHAEDYSHSSAVSSGFSTPTSGGGPRPPAPAPGNLNLENVGGAIEGWVRRMANKAMTPTEAQARNKAARASVGTPGKGAGGIGDLIEMTNEFEIGGDDEDEEGSEAEDLQRGRPGSAGGVPGRSGGGGAGGKQRTTGADYFGSAVARRERVGSSQGGGKGRKGE